VSEKLKKLELQQSQLKARIRKLQAAESQEKRRLDTRVKIILGGALLSSPGHEDFIRDLVNGLTRDSDRKTLKKAGFLVDNTTENPSPEPTGL